ncbi:autotransporter secretion outer membrane protein TamA [Pseudorhodobacter antarcticus]|uniref:Autotransporter secretion outer membrane protein TamA n=2 Tax=Pseudorhodobacter antarcticus TaxID=1077947 RepID=A0A1H8E9E1_9RHOB|nr:autotransporter assembly complex family protein [Pseudorhodobacter antarcticus]SEN15477.1 autotransporter secretion outer membrane protein TamA [Pseudorhodobacter antarcticus]
MVKVKDQGWGAAALVLGAGLFVTPAHALDQVDFTVLGGDAAVETSLRGASFLLAAQAEGSSNDQDLFATARAEYGRLLGALYAMGRYSGVIEIRIDGREAADIAPLDTPKNIRRIALTVNPGPAFTFDVARVGPLAADTALPKGFAKGQVAQSDVISVAAGAAVDGWRTAGHAKATVTDQDITADHAAATLDAKLTVTAGPRLRFGPLAVQGQDRMELRRIVKIAGLPTGEQFSPEALEDAAERLRRTGIFRSVALEEDADITAPDTLGITAKLVEERPRRFGFGVEVASSEGAKVNGFWLHRNLLGGGERLRVDGEIAQIGAQNSGVDYSLGVTLDRPATLSADTTGTAFFRIGHEAEEDYTQDFVETGLGFTQYVSREMTARVGLEYSQYQVKFATGSVDFRTLGLPVGVNWDKRNSKTDATKGFYIDAEAAPFLGFGGTASGLRLELDARAYRGFGVNDRITLAGRVQLRGVEGGDITTLPPEYLSYSGGGGTVRGQEYRSLGFASARTGRLTGGTGFVGASVEVRTKVTDTIGIVGFADYGRIASSGLFGGQTLDHAGAGLGVRYATGLGPIRLDVAAPVSGGKGGVQIYIGIGQSF